MTCSGTNFNGDQTINADRLLISKCLVSNSANLSTLQPLEFVGRGSETQLEVSEKF